MKFQAHGDIKIWKQAQKITITPWIEEEKCMQTTKWNEPLKIDMGANEPNQVKRPQARARLV